MKTLRINKSHDELIDDDSSMFEAQYDIEKMFRKGMPYAVARMNFMLSYGEYSFAVFDNTWDELETTEIRNDRMEYAL
tara:strand:+ start:10473 stop:10706 length:234 start_codon:yes stop_codon:yes gene_type:complete